MCIRDSDYAKKLVKEAVSNIDDSASEPVLKNLFPNLNEFATKEEVLDSIDSVTLDEVNAFYNYVMQNSMAKAVLTAPVEKNPALEQTVLNKLSQGQITFKPFKFDYFQCYEPIKEDLLLKKAEPRNQADIVQAFKFKTNYNPKDHAVFTLLNTILGGGPSSRLFEDLREKQKLAYRVESDISYTGNTGVMTLAIKTTTDNPTENIQQYENVKKSLDGFKSHIEKLKNEKVSQQELEAAKLRIKTKLLNTLESSESQTIVLSASKDSPSGIDAVNKTLALVDEITPDDLQQAARYIFDGKSITSILASQNTLDNMNLG